MIGAGLALWAAGGFRDPEEVDTGPLWFAAVLAILAVDRDRRGWSARSHRQRDTDAGRAEAGRWLGLRRFLVDHGDFPTAPAPSVAIWDAYLGWAAALGLAPIAVESLPLGTEDDHQAWSSVGGTWRRVEVRYPRWRPGWGRHPLMAVRHRAAVDRPRGARAPRPRARLAGVRRVRRAVGRPLGRPRRRRAWP